MTNVESIIRAWKDEDSFLGLSDDERQALPANPAGLIELNDGDLREVAGGTSEACCSLPPAACRTAWYCTHTDAVDPCCTCPGG